MNKKGMLIVVSGPSGVGKGSILRKIFEQDSNLAFSVSCTTRAPRTGEEDGVHYFFITKQQFEENIKNGKMLEYTCYCDNYYGTSAEYVEKQRLEGKDVVLEIEIDGAQQIMKNSTDALTIFIAPPSFEVLVKRLSDRGTEDSDVIMQRVEAARKELSFKDEYKYIVINDDLDDAILEVKNIINAERQKNK